MRTLFILLLFLSLSAYGQQTSVAVLPSDGTALNNDELEVLTDKIRQAALKVLPTESFVLLKQDVIVKRLGGAEKYIKECTERRFFYRFPRWQKVQGSENRQANLDVREFELQRKRLKMLW